MDTNVVQVLRTARALIDDPKRWLKGQAYRSIDMTKKHHIDGRSYQRTETVQCFCSDGAIVQASFNMFDEHQVADPLFGSLFLNPTRRAFRNAIGTAIVLPPVLAEENTPVEMIIAHWNDDIARTHDEVMAMFDAAIKKEEEKV